MINFNFSEEEREEIYNDYFSEIKSIEKNNLPLEEKMFLKLLKKSNIVYYERCRKKYFGKKEISLEYKTQFNDISNFGFSLEDFIEN